MPTALPHSDHRAHPRKRPTGRWGQAALGFVILALVALVVVPIWAGRRTQSLRSEISTVAEPARSLADRMQTSLAREVAAIRGYLITRDPSFLDLYREALAEQAAAHRQLHALAPALGPEVTERVAALQRTAAEWQPSLEPLLRGEIAPEDLARRLGAQQERYGAVVAAGNRLDQALAREITTRREAIRKAERRALFLTSILVALSLLAAFAVAMLAGRLQRLTGETERLAGEIERQRRLLQTVTNNATSALLMMDTRGRGAFWNPAAERMTGYSAEEVMGRTLHELVHHTHPDGTPFPIEDCPIDLALPHGVEVEGYEDVFIRKNGEFFPVVCAAKPIVVDGKPTGTVIEVRDVTEEKQAQEKLRRAIEEAEVANEQLRTTQAIIDAELAHGTVDQLLETLLDAVREALGGDTATVLLVEEDGEHLSVRASRGLEEEVGDDVRVPVGRGFAGRIAATKEPLIVEDVAELEVVSPILRERIASLIGAPLVVEGEVVGVIHVGTALPHHFTENDLRLLRLIAERSANVLERVRLYEAAVEGNRAKSEFLATMSHELRTPLNAILGFTDLLEMGIPEPIPEKSRAQVKRIDESARHLLRIIEEILTFSRVEAAQEEVSARAVDLREVVRSAVEMTEPMAAKKGLRLEVEADGVQETIWTDPQKVRQILVNLLGNAIKFTENGVVALRAWQEDQEVVLEVRDTGIGISPAHISRIFDPFWQVDQSKTREAGGTGLGLTVSRSLARLLGGEITVYSTPAEGSRFEVRFPARVESLSSAGHA